MIPQRRLGQPGISVRILRGQGGWGTGCRVAEADPGKGGQPDCCCARLSATAQRLTPSPASPFTVAHLPTPHAPRTPRLPPSS